MATNGGNASTGERTDGDSTANECGLADHLLTTDYPLPPNLRAIRDSITYGELRHLAQEVLDKITPDVYALGVKDGQAQLLVSQREQREQRKVARGQKVWVTVVYFIVSPTAIKIGRTKDAARRTAVIQTSHPEPLQLVATVDGGLALEKEYHRRFAPHRLRGEWFAPHPDILSEIARLQTLAA